MKQFSQIRQLLLLLALPVVLVLISCNSPSAVPEVEKPNYRQLGDSLINATFDTLRSALTKAIKEKGAAGAVSFCNESAYPITSAYTTEKITLKRVAEKYRNPKNAPDSLDMIQWQQFVAAKEKGDPLQPILLEEKNTTYYYKPIVLQPTCSACHGDSQKDILPPVLTTIDSLYPDDRAKGFAPGDLRGMWKVAFAEK